VLDDPMLAVLGHPVHAVLDDPVRAVRLLHPVRPVLAVDLT
jgi:hypothetical protein